MNSGIVKIFSDSQFNTTGVLYTVPVGKIARATVCLTEAGWDGQIRMGNTVNGSALLLNASSIQGKNHEIYLRPGDVLICDVVRTTGRCTVTILEL